MDAIGIADRNTLAGVVRMHSACKGAGLRPLIGCRLDLTDAPSLLAYPIDRDGYGRLSRLLSLGKMRAEKGECELTLHDVADHADGIAFIAWPEDDLDAFEAELPRLRDALTSLRHVAASWLYRGDDAARIERLDRLARAQRLHDPRDQRRPLSRARPAPAAGRRHLHPREGDDHDRGLSAQPQCRAAFEIAGRDGAAVRALAARDFARRARSPTRFTSASTSCATNIRGRRCPKGGLRSNISSI